MTARSSETTATPDRVEQAANAMAALDGELQPVERIEMEDWSAGYRQPAEPEWRVVISGYCANFPTETAANNFRNAILARLAAAKAEGRAEMREEAARLCDRRAQYFDCALGYRDWTDASRSYRATANDIRALPTSPAPASEETQAC